MSRTIRRLVAPFAVALLAPAVAAAAPSATTPPATTIAHGSLTLYLPNAFFVNRGAVTVPGRGVPVYGVVHPYVPGQSVTVKAFVGRRLIKTQRLLIKPSKKRTYGSFTGRVASPKVGDVTVVATHVATSTLSGFKDSRRFTSLDDQIGFGSTGRFVELIQRRLAALHFYVPQSGVYDQGTGLALDAYHRLLGWGTYQTLDRRTVSFLLNGWGAFRVRYPGHGVHAEGNLGNQLLALVNGSKVQYIFPISSGKPSTPTVLGNFSVYRRVPGYLPDGMYFSNFFTGGYAIHGYNPAPDYPASHGCMRLPIVDAIFVYNWLNFGDSVDVY